MSKVVYLLRSGSSSGKRDKEIIIKGLSIKSEFIREFDSEFVKNLIVEYEKL